MLITGTDFTGSVSVTLGDVSATNVQIISSTQITATTPAHIAGAADIVITTPFGIATAPSAYTYVAYSDGGGNTDSSAQENVGEATTPMVTPTVTPVVTPSGHDPGDSNSADM